MSDTLYRVGLLVLVFGGFLASNSTGASAGLGVVAMLVGVLVGIGGAINPAVGDHIER